MSLVKDPCDVLLDWRVALSPATAVLAGGGKDGEEKVEEDGGRGWSEVLPKGYSNHQKPGEAWGGLS